MLSLATLVLLVHTADLPTITIDRDNIGITHSCRVAIAAVPIIDADGNGIIHITADNITVEFAVDSQPLHGAKPDQLPDTFAGTGIVIIGKNVTLSGAKVRGFKIGIHAKHAHGLTIHHTDVSGNFAQRLKSTPQAEDASDWLWPHANDNNEWITKYGAGLCIEDSSNVTLYDIRARKTQNGIVLDAVNDSKVYDCDCSFLSGWGLAMWRSNRNVISRNAFDFCVRGYSHGVYNRGQDSAGILMFEQCGDNVIVENSATHGGDGFFGFAGKEALGEVNPQPSPAAYKHRGNNGNTFLRNDFSFAAAHGLELTFSFRNRISENVFRGNAICGIWGGYSQATIIDRNHFVSNGEGAYGLERGGVNIEHGRYNMIALNRFEQDRCGVHLWWDEDTALMASTWAKANEPASSSNFIVGNTFTRLPLAIQLRETTLTDVAANTFEEVAVTLDADAESPADLNTPSAVNISDLHAPVVETLGVATPVGARADLAGRENICMTEWGPWDRESPLLQFVRCSDTADEYRLRGARRMPAEHEIAIEGEAVAIVRGELIGVRAKQPDMLTPYRISVDIDGQLLSASGLLTGGSWQIRAFPSSIDPRENADKWREDGAAKAHRLAVDTLDLRFGSGGLSDAMELPVPLPRDHFGIIATRVLIFPAGRWRITTTSDDGIRVWLNNVLAIDDWTHHGPTRHDYHFELAEPRAIDMRVEYFELDGHATLRLDVQRQQ